MRTKKTEQKRGRGAPNRGLSEAAVLVRGPLLLLEAVKAAAAKEGIDAAEYWRRAARVRLGWREVVEPPSK